MVHARKWEVGRGLIAGASDRLQCLPCGRTMLKDIMAIILREKSFKLLLNILYFTTNPPEHADSVASIMYIPKAVSLHWPLLKETNDSTIRTCTHPKRQGFCHYTHHSRKCRDENSRLCPEGMKIAPKFPASNFCL